MELRHVRYFLALVEECHFGRAAQRLHVAQSALSQQLKQLERELGTTLFARSTRRVELTEAGRHLVTHARSILAEVERAEEQMALLATGRAGRVSIGFVGTATYDVLPRIARTVRAQLPGVSLELRGELLNPELVEGLLSGTYDLALLRTDAPVDAAVEVTTLRSERLVAVLPTGHPLAGRREIPSRHSPTSRSSSTRPATVPPCTAGSSQPAPVQASNPPPWSRSVRPQRWSCSSPQVTASPWSRSRYRVSASTA